MSRHRILYRLASLAVGAALLLGAACDWGQLSAIVATLGPGDVMLGVLSLVLATMTGAAGVLIAADFRADMAAAQAWHEIHAETAVIATPSETAPIGSGDALYAAGPQDEGLSQILLAHRFMAPVPPRNDIGSLALDHGENRAEPAGSSIKRELQAVRTISHTDDLGERLAAPPATQRRLAQLISSNAKRVGKRKGHSVRMATAAKRIANAGTRWDWPAFGTATASRVTESGSGCNEIVLADRNGRDENSAPSDVAPEPEITAQPCSRGPPRATFRRHVADGPTHLGKPFRETDRSRANPPAEFVVTDNLGDRVPICEAELHVLEAYLGDMLNEILTADATSQVDGKS